MTHLSDAARPQDPREEKTTSPPAEGARKTPAAGPHAKPGLTAPEKTPGAGSLPDPERPQDGDATTG